MRNTKKIKQNINSMLKELGVSKSYFKKTMPRVSGSVTEFVRAPIHEGGKKMSLRQQELFLKRMIETQREIEAEKSGAEKEIKTEPAFSPEEEAMDIAIKSVFER